MNTFTLVRTIFYLRVEISIEKVVQNYDAKRRKLSGFPESFDE
jgi:hypothetical protein